MARRLCSAALSVALIAGAGCQPARTCGAGAVERDGVCVLPGTDAGLADAGLADAEVADLDGSTLSDADVPDSGALPLPDDVHVIDGIGHDGTAEAYAAIDRVVGDATYIGLGESVHTSGGYYRAKHRLLRHLVEEHGFRAFAMESPWQDADRVSRWVQTCPDDDPVPVIRDGLFGVWASEEVVDLLGYLCEWNGAHPDDPVTFFGFDIQQPWHDGLGIRVYLVQVAGAEAEPILADVDACDGATSESAAAYSSWETTPTAATHTRCLMGLDAAEAWLTAHQDEAIAATSADELALARLRLVGLRGWELQTYHYTDGPDPDRILSFEGRDRAMAYALQELRRSRVPEARVAVWAHNSHLAMQQEDVRGYFRGARSMGTFLATELGDAYAPIALVSYDVRINWIRVGDGPIGLADDDSVEGVLHGLGHPMLFVDLGASASMRAIDPRALVRMGGERLIPGDQFSGILFLDVSERMNALFW